MAAALVVFSNREDWEQGWSLRRLEGRQSLMLLAFDV